MDSKKDEDENYENDNYNSVANPELNLNKLKTVETIVSQINEEDKYNPLQNAINNTEIKEMDIMEYQEVSPSIIQNLEKIVSTAPKLELIVKDSLFLEIGLKIKINALGLEGKSLRGKKDGYTYFGA